MNRLFKHFSTLIFLSLLPLLSCAQSDSIGDGTREAAAPQTQQPDQQQRQRQQAQSQSQRPEEEEKDLSCSYFYFLWGTHAEYSNGYDEALEAYEKALICDPSADYIREKLPLLFVHKGESGKAITMLREAINKNPVDTPQRSLLARIYLQRREEDKAVQEYKAIIAYDPKNSEILLRLGVLLSQIGNLEEGRTYLNKLLENNQNTYFAHLYLARIAGQLDEIDTAVFHYNHALELNWSTDLCYELGEFHLQGGRYQKAIDTFRKILAATDSDEQARLGIVQALLALNRDEAAIAELGVDGQLSSTPDHTSLILSKLYLRNGNKEKAIEHLEAILKNSDNAEARYLLGIVYSNIEQFQKALDVLAGITPEQKEFEDGVFLQTKILHQTERIPEALNILEAFMARQDSIRALFFLLAASLYQESGKPQRSLELLAHGASLYPQDEQLLFEYGLQLERTAQLEHAIQVMEQVVALNPDHAEALNFIGYSWADKNHNLDQALSYIERAIELKPGNGYIQDSLGWVHYRLGNLEHAKQALLDALKTLPNDPHVHDHIGDVYRDLGQRDDALKSYKKSLEYQDDETKKEAVRAKIEHLEKQ